SDVSQRNADGENTAATGPRPKRQRVPQHSRNAFGDRKPETQSPLLIVVGMVDAAKLFEYLAPLLLRYAATGVPHFDIEHVAAPPAAEKNASALRVAYGVRQIILQHSPQQFWIRHHDVIAVRHPQTQAPLACKDREFGDERSDDLGKREMLDSRLL